MKLAIVPLELAEANAFVVAHHRHHGVVQGHKFSLGTYILASESGASLRASGWRLIGEVKGRSWSCPSRLRVDKHPTQDKLFFERTP